MGLAYRCTIKYYLIGLTAAVKTEKTGTGTSMRRENVSCGIINSFVTPKHIIKSAFVTQPDQMKNNDLLCFKLKVSTKHIYLHYSVCAVHGIFFFQILPSSLYLGKYE